MATEIIYYQGETITADIEGDAYFNLDTNDFSAIFYLLNNIELVIEKADMTFISANKYRFEIANTVTALMPTGTYVQEVLYGEAKTQILQSECFEIKKSRAKKYVGN